MNPENEIHELMQKLRVDPSAEMDERMHGDISKILAELKRTIPAEQQSVVWRVITKNRITKFGAAAAVIIIALLIGLTIIPDVGGGVALAEVFDKFNEIRSFAYRIRITQGQNGRPIGKQDDIWEMHILESRDYGSRTYWYSVKGPEPIPVNITEPHTKVYKLQSEVTRISVRPGEKTFWREKLPSGSPDWQEYRDCRIFLTGFTHRPYTWLGRDMIDGIQVELFESTDPDVTSRPPGNGVAHLWVDTKTKLPVRMKIERFANSTDDSPTKKLIFYGFEWNVEIDAADFDPNIPDDYIELVLKGEPPFDEKKIVAALRFFAQLTDGRYPSDLSGKTVYEELDAAWIANYGVPLEQQSRREDILNTRWLDATIGYYDSLSRQNKDPAYHGDKVTAKDSGRVLMRWKISDDRYRVIFGNLTVKDIPTGRLSDLEKLLME